MRWPWRRQARPIEPRRAAVSIRAMELETAKEILAEIFGAMTEEVEEMMKKSGGDKITKTEVGLSWDLPYTPTPWPLRRLHRLPRIDQAT